MVGMTEAISALGEALKKKTTAFLTLGVLLMIASMYINVLKPSAGEIGVNHSIVIIWFAILFQVISWIKFFNLFPLQPKSAQVKLFPAQPGLEHIVTYMNIKKKFAKCFFLRFPQVVLVLFTFTLSASVAGTIKFSSVYNPLMIVVLFIMTLGVAFCDFICGWYIETHLEKRH